MDKTNNRRKSHRHPANWKVAVVLDKLDGKPAILHTQTLDLSLGGVAIVSEHGDLTGTVVTVLLAHAPGQGGENPKIMKARARVVSSAQALTQSSYRLGLNFIQWTDDGLEMFADILSAIEVSRLRAAAGAAAPAAPAEAAPPAAGSRLARLKELAQAKLSEKKEPETQEQVNDRVSEALKRVFQYLKELAEQLNVVQPACAGYTIVGVPEFTGLAWESGRADFRTRELSPAKRLYERVTLNFRLSGKKQIRIALDSPARTDRLKQVLAENKIEFTTQETRNDRGHLERTTFVFPCEVTANVLLEGNFETGRILLRMVNVERFGILEHRLAPEAFTEEALEELAGFILGENRRIDLLLQGA